jgi:drug/metabolite transporter (DMT)-like permease
MDGQLIGYSAALGSAASWAAGSILFKPLSDRLSPMGLTLSKAFLSVLFLGAVTLILRLDIASTEGLGLLIISGLLGIALGDALFFAALRDLGPVTMIIFFFFGQFFTACLAIIFLGEMPAIQAWFGMAVTLAGVGLLLWPKISAGSDMGVTTRRGIALGCAYTLCFSLSMIVAKEALENAHTISATFVRMAAGAAGMFVVGIVTRKMSDWLTPFKDLKMLGFLTLAVAIVTFGGFWLSLVAIKYVDVAVANTLGATEPLFVLPLAVVFLKERVTRFEVGGTVLTVVGVLLIVVDDAKGI